MGVQIRSRVKQRAWRGVTLVEMLVVIVIMSILSAILLPAVQAAREMARPAAVRQYMSQIGLAVLNFEASRGMLPSGGEGTDPTSHASIFDTTVGQSVFMQILPYLEHSDITTGNQYTARYDFGKYYNETAAPQNQAAAKTVIAEFICPSDPFPPADPMDGYGRLDYFATVYTDIDPDPNKPAPPARLASSALRMDGAMAVPACTIDAITDGLGNTMAFIEDAGRKPSAYSAACTSGALSDYALSQVTKNPDGTKYVPVDTAATAPCASGAGACHGVWRWADQDAGGSGISGQASSDRSKFINGNRSPIGGTTDVSGCVWSINNCGANDEPFAFHPGGCNSVFMDGSVHFLIDDIDGRVLRYMITRSEGIPITQSGTGLPAYQPSVGR